MKEFLTNFFNDPFKYEYQIVCVLGAVFGICYLVKAYWGMLFDKDEK